MSFQSAGVGVFFPGELFDAFFLLRFFFVRVSFSGAGGVDLLLACIVVELSVGPVRCEA